MKTSRSYVPELDSLRFYAVAGVMVSHFIPSGDPVRELLPWGVLGVQLFYCLSGFLITGILLSARDHAGSSRPGIIRNFYARRVLRIFPLYYLYLIAAAFALPDSRPYLAYFIFYVQNFMFAGEPVLWSKFMSHLWTLAVEEQFYIVWPFLMLFAPREKLAIFVVAGVVVGPLFRGAGALMGVPDFTLYMMMPGHIDTFAMGGLLAVLSADRPKASPRFGAACLLVGAPLVILDLILKKVGGSAQNFHTFLSPLASGIFFAGVLWWVTANQQHRSVRFLALPATVYLGRISYGLYVIHFNVPGFLREIVFPRLGISTFGIPWLDIWVSITVTIALAAVSWHLIEYPINSLKSRVPYEKPRAVSTE